MKRITLKPGRVAPVRGGHPWIFSGAIARGLDGCEPGEPVRVVDHEGHFAAVGYANPRTPIAVRVCALDDVEVGASLVARRLDEALALRRETLPADLRAYRVLNAEGDRLPGVVVDRYGDVLVVQLLTAGAARLGPALVEALVKRLEPATIYERSEGSVRTEEGVPGTRGLLHGAEPPVPLTIEEHGARLLVDVVHGQKTGFFLDQRDNRQRVRALASGRRVLNCFSYSGAFGIAAGLGGATHVTSLDTSRPALELGEKAWEASGLDPAAATWVEADVFDWLREGEAGTVFDVIVCDPPPFARRRRDRDSAIRGYRDVNLQAFRRLAPGGWMLTCSCSQHLDRAAFREVVMHSAAAAGRAAQVVAELGHPPDHPTALAHVEGEYLKALLLRV